MRGDDLSFGADDALRHRRLRDEERAAISAVVKPATARSVSATCASCDSAGWQHVKIKPEAVVGLGRVRRPSVDALQQRELLAISPVAAKDVDGAPPRRGHQPRARVVGDALFRPFLERRHQAVLDDLLGEVEVAEDADQGRGQPSGLLAEDGGDRLVVGARSARLALERSAE